MPASRYEYTGGKSADNPVSAKGLPKPWPETMERAILSEGPMLEDEGIHPVGVEKRDDGEADGEGDEHHQT